MTKAFIVAAALMMAGSMSQYAANADKGKALFESPKLGGGTTGRSCATCHKDGEGLSRHLFEGVPYAIMGGSRKGLADVINTCIEKSLGGTAIDPKGAEMQDLIAYIKTLVVKPAAL